MPGPEPAEHLEQFIVAMGGKPLQGAGNVSHQQALGKAEAAHTTFRAQQSEQPSEVETAFLETVSRIGGLSLLARTSPRGWLLVGLGVF